MFSSLDAVARSTAPETRFWKKVVKSSGCWLWTASLDSDGYGHLRVAGQLVKAHRYSFKLAHGRESFTYVLHECDVRNCVRPDHLFEGTALDNAADRDTKGRGSAVRRFTLEDVAALTGLREDGYTYQAIADIHDVSISVVFNAINGKGGYV